MAMPVSYHCAAATDVPPETLYRMLWLRLRVFVVEQRAAYPELDGRDIERRRERHHTNHGEPGRYQSRGYSTHSSQDLICVSRSVERPRL